MKVQVFINGKEAIVSGYEIEGGAEGALKVTANAYLADPTRYQVDMDAASQQIRDEFASLRNPPRFHPMCRSWPTELDGYLLAAGPDKPQKSLAESYPAKAKAEPAPETDPEERRREEKTKHLQGPDLLKTMW